MFRRKHSGKVGAEHSAARLRPLARSTGTAAEKSVRMTRAWLAPQAERAGQAVQETIAPKVSAVLSSAARHLDPKTPSRRRWSRGASFAGLAAAAAAIGKVIRSRTRPSAAAGSGSDGPELAQETVDQPSEPTGRNQQVRAS